MKQPPRATYAPMNPASRRRPAAVSVRVGRLPLAAALAMGASLPWAAAQTVITPLQGAAATQTLVTPQAGGAVVTTATLRDGNAFNTFSAFRVGQGDQVGLVVPQGANWLVNVVRDSRVQVDGHLQGRLADGSVGGNLLFIDSHGFAVGPQGRVQAGRLVFAAPSSTFVDGLLSGGPGLSAQQVDGVLGGQFDRSATGAVVVDGVIEASDGVQIMAGQGQGSAQAVSVQGRVSLTGWRAGTAVNLGQLHDMAPVQVRDGVIDITTPGDVRLNGRLLADGDHWSGAGVVRVVAGGDLALGAQAELSASAVAGSGLGGGVVSTYAQGNASTSPGAALRARGDGAGAGGFIEFSAARRVVLDGLTLDGGSDSGAAGLAYIDPEEVVLVGVNDLRGGTDAVYEATKSVTFQSGVTVNTRQVAAGADPTSDAVASTGNSGHIVVRAPTIKVEQGVVLDAGVVNSGGTTWVAGDITLLAKASSNGSSSSQVGLADADASIDVAGTLKGRDITLQASIESEAVYSGVDAMVTQGLVELGLRRQGLTGFNLAYTQATGDATVRLRETAVLKASDDILLKATADRSAGAALQNVGSSASNLSAGFAIVEGSTRVDIDAGAQLTAADTIEAVAASKTRIAMNSAAKGNTSASAQGSNLASVVFAGSVSNVNTAVNVGDGAVLTSGGDTLLQAFHSGHYQTKALATAYGDAKAGVVGALSLQQSGTEVVLAGDVNAGGDVKAMAMNASAMNLTSATTEIAQDPGLDLTLPPTLRPSTAEAEAQLASGFAALAGKVATLSEESSGGTSSAGSSSPSTRMAGALTWSESTHTTQAKIASGATVVAGGDAVVDAQALVGRLQSVGLSQAVSELEGSGTSPTALSVAFNYADHAFTTRAEIGAGASVTSNHVAVHAATDMPLFYVAGLPTKWGNFYDVYENLVGGANPLLDGFNTRVGATSTATDLALSGAVNLSFLRNDTRAWVDRNATLQTRVADGVAWSYQVHEVGFDSDIEDVLSVLNPYRLDKELGVLAAFIDNTREVLDANGQPTGHTLDEIRFERSQSASALVQAENHTQSVHLAGGETSGTANGGVAVGGTFSLVDRSNTAVAGIADGVQVTTHRLDVRANTEEWLLSITPSAGSGEGLTANGMVSYNKLTENTRASISREATVKADVVNLQADLSAWVFGVTGAVTKTDNSGVGIGVALNKLDGQTTALIGDNDTEGGGAERAEGAAGSVQTSALNVKATSEGTIGAVGVAGVAAQSSAAPDSPPPPSTSSNMSSTVAADSSSVQGQLDGSGTSTAPVGDATAQLQEEGGGDEGAAAAEPQADQPPPFSIAAAGAVVTNFSNIDTTAQIDGAVVRGLNEGATRVGVQALSDLTQVSVAGGGALAMANNASTTFSSAIAGAVAIQRSDDDTSARITGSTITGVADEGGALKVQALKSGERTAVATGLSVNLSKGSSSDLSLVGSVSATATSDDTVASVEGSTLRGQVLAPTALEAQVVAYDRSRIGAGGGALSMSKGKGSAGIGATVTLVDHAGSTRAVVDGGTLEQIKKLSVAALSSQKVVGVGAVAGVQTDSSSLGQLMGAFVFNDLNNTVQASITGDAAVNVKGDVVVQAGGAPADGLLDTQMGAVRGSYVTDYDMASTSSGYTPELKAAVSGESVVGVAGALSVALGNNSTSVGLSYVQNKVQTSYDATVDAAITATGTVQVKALSEADVVAVSAGAGASKGKFSGMGSASVNLIGQQSQALVLGGSVVNAAGLAVTTHSSGNLFSLAGNVSIAMGSAGTAMGAAVSYTQTGARDYTDAGASSPSTTARGASHTAAVRDSTVNLGSGQLAVQAVNTSDTQSIAASGAFSAGSVALAGTATWNEMGDVTAAEIDNTLLTAGRVSVKAGESLEARSARIRSLAGGLAASTGYSGAIALGFNTIESVRSARIARSNLFVADSVSVEAAAEGTIQTISATLAGGSSYAGAGSFSVNRLNADVLAELDGDADGVPGGARNTLSGTASSLTVRASGSGTIESFAGSLSAAGTGAIGGAVAVNEMGKGAENFRVRASLANLSQASAAAVTVEAGLAGSIGSVAASGSGAGTAALNGSVTTNTIEATVQAEVNNLHQSANSGALRVTATNDADIASLAGTISGAGTAAVGAAVSVNDIGGEASAKLANSVLRATGAVAVQASATGDIRSVAAGVSGGGSVALAGSNSTNGITSTVLAQLNNVRQDAASASLQVLAQDSSRIQAFAGTVAGGGTAAGGAAFALNFLGRTANDADSSKQVKAEVLDSALNSGGAVQVKALSTSSIESIGVAAGVSGNAAVTGSNTTNLLEDEITASWSGGSLNGTASALTVQADDAATVHTLAGNFSAGLTGAFGAAVAVSTIDTAARASLSGVTLNPALALVVDADLRGEIRSVAASGAVDLGASVNGSFTTNRVGASVTAETHNLNQATTGTSVSVTADNDADIASLAGTVAGSGGAAAGVAVALNDIGGSVVAKAVGGTLNTNGALVVRATASGTIESVAAGAAVGGSASAAGSNTTNALTSTVLAQMDGVDQYGSPSSVAVVARDLSTIRSFAGSVSGSGSASAGGAFAQNFLGRTLDNADSTKVVKAEVTQSVLRAGGAVQVNASSSGTIESMAVAAGGGANLSLNGSNTTNVLEDEVLAVWSGSALAKQGESVLTVSARSASQIDSLAGNVSGSGGASVGAALAVNRIGSTTNASLVGVTVDVYRAGTGQYTMTADDIVLAAESDNAINTAAVGMSAGAAGVQGSVAVSVIGNQTHARLGDDGYVTNAIATDSVAVTAHSRDRIKALAGSVGLGAAGIGAAGGVLTNIVSSTTTAGVQGWDTHVNAAANGLGLSVRDTALQSAPDLMGITALTDSVLDGAVMQTHTVRGLAVRATSIQQLGALSAVAGGGATGAAGAAVNVDRIGGSTRAYIDSARFVNDFASANAAQVTDVRAANHAMIASAVSALAVGSVGVSGSMGTEVVERSTSAEVVDSARVYAKNAAVVKAVSTNAVAQISAGAAGGSVAGLAGSGDVVLLKGSTQALVQDASVEADSLSVVADGTNASNLVAGSIGGGAAVGVGLSFTVNVSDATVSAKIHDSAIRADGAVVVDADNRTESFSVSASAGVGGLVGTGVAVGASVSVMEGATEAKVSGTTTIGRRTLASGLLASAGNAPVTINLASDDDVVTARNQNTVRLALSDLNGPVSSSSAVVTVSDGESTVTAVRQADGTYTANVAGLADGVLMAQVLIDEGGVQKVSTTTLSKSTGINGSDNLPVAASKPAAQTRIAALSGFSQVDARNQDAVRFVLKGSGGPVVDSTAGVIVSDGTRQVTATANADGSYTANVSSLGDGVLTALVTTAQGETARVTFQKTAGAGSLSVTADETIVLNHNTGQVGVGGASGVGSSANVVVGKSTVDAAVSAQSVRVGGALTVAAERSADIDMITATGGGGGVAGVSGAVGVLVFGSAPDSNASTELNGSGGSLQRIGSATQADRAKGTGGALSDEEAASLNASGRYDTQGAFTGAGASGAHRTSATVSAPTVVAGSLAVRSLDRTRADNNAGAVALGGVAGVSAGVAVTLLGGANQATVSSAQLLVADDVLVESGTRGPASGPAIESRAIAGAGGWVGVGAAVSVAANATANGVSLSGALQAGGAVNLQARDEASLLSEAWGATAGAMAVGAVAATATQTGTVQTALAGEHASEGFAALAERNASTVAKARGGVAGVFAGAGAGASASDAGAVLLTLASGTALNAGDGDLSLAARANPLASASALGVSVATGAAVGVSVADAQVQTAVAVQAAGPVRLSGADVLVSSVLGTGDGAVKADAVAGGGGLLLGLQGAVALASNRGESSVGLGSVLLSATGDVGISASGAMGATTEATGVGAGFVGAGVAVASTVSESTVSASATGLGGQVAGQLTLSARGDDTVDADAVAGSGGVVAGAGAQASVDHRQAVSASGTTGASGLNVGGTTTISADRKVRYDSQTSTVNASAFGGSGAVTSASLTGSATAGLGDGSRLTGGQLRVLATNDVQRQDLSANSAEGGGGGVIAGAGADASTVISGTATASLGDDVTLVLGDQTAGLLEVRAYNQLRGSSRARLDVGGAIPVALVDTSISSDAVADAIVGANNDIQVSGEVHVNALSYVDLEANTITKTYGAAAGAQGDASALANVTNRVTVGANSVLIGEREVNLLAGQDRDYWRNKSFVTARADLFNHSAIPVSINPEVDATLNLTNNVTVAGEAVRSGGAIRLGGQTGTYVVEGKGKVSDWTRDVGELIGLSSEYGRSTKHLNATTTLAGLFEAGYGNKQTIVINPNGSIDSSQTQGNIRYSIGTEDLAATGAAYLDTLYAQLQNYGSVPEVKAFVEAEIAFYLQTLLNEGFATIETDPDTGKTRVVPQASVPGTFITFQNVRAGSGNIELFGDNVVGTADLIARADSQILIDNHSPMNVRVKDLVIDSTGGFAKLNGVNIKSSADIATGNRDVKTGVAITVDSIDTRAASNNGVGEDLPTLSVINRYVPNGTVSSSEVIASAPDGSSADLRQDQMRAPEIRVNGLLYNKLGPINLSNVAGSISVTAEDPLYVPRVDGLEVQVSAGKNFVLSSPTVSQSVGGSPENLYAVAYTTDQQDKLDAMGLQACGSARAGNASATSFDPSCLRNGSGGIFSSGGIFLGARYLNINGTIQSGQPVYSVTLDSRINATISAWETQWAANRGAYLAQGRSPLVQVAGRLPTDSESAINKQFADRKISEERRDELLAELQARRRQPIVYYDAETRRLKVAATDVKGGLVEVVGSIINTGGGVIRALDGYARFNIDNQTNYALDLLGLDTGGEAGVVRITDLSRPVIDANGRVSAYKVTTFARDASGTATVTTTAGRGASAPVLSSAGIANSVAINPLVHSAQARAAFQYLPVDDSTYVWSAGYDYAQERRYWYQKSSVLWGAINTGSISWNSVDTINKTASAMPEGIYVTTADAPAQNFWMGGTTYATQGETPIYYRSWKKCGFLCFKKTFYVDYRTESGAKDVFTQRVRADHPISVELVGYSTGNIAVKSLGNVGIAGNITNDSGTVSIQSVRGAIEQLSGGAAVKGEDLRFSAASGIGSQGAPVNVITGDGSFTATSTAGNIAFQSLGGALRVNEVSTTGKVWLMGDESIVGVDPNKVHVRGSRIELAAPRGGIGVFNADGSVKSTLNIQTEDSPGGGIRATAGQGIALKQASGNLWVDQVVSNGGDVYIETAGDLIDNNRNETRDVRTEQELLALWSAAALQGDGAQNSRQLTLTNTRAQYRRYWSLRNASVVSVDASTGRVTEYTADQVNPATYRFVFSDVERTQLAQSGLTGEQITALQDARTTEFLELHSRYGNTSYQLTNDLIIAEVNAANLAAGGQAVDARATWSDAELKSPLPSAIFFKDGTDTQTRIEEPNVVGNRVVLRPGGKIGRDEGAVTIDLRKAGGLTTEDQLTIMSAETDDMVLDKDKWLLTVVKKDTFNVLSKRLNVNANGFVYLGADTTDAYPTGGDANLEQVSGQGEVRIKVSGSILNASSSSASVIQGHKAILEAAAGAIGSASKPVTLSLTGGGTPANATLVARAADGIWLQQTGDMRVAEVNSPRGTVSLTAQGAIIDARGERNQALQAQTATLTAQGGAVGSALNPLVVKMSDSGGVNATSANGYSIYLQGAGDGLTVGDLSSGQHIDLKAPGGTLRVRGDGVAKGRVDVAAAGDVVMQAGSSLRSQAGNITVSGDAVQVAELNSALDIDLLASGAVKTVGDVVAIGGVDVDAGGDVTMGNGTLMRAVSGGVAIVGQGVGLSRVDAARAATVVASGSITDTSEADPTVNVTGRGVTLLATGSIGTAAKAVDVLTKERTKLIATAGGNAYLGASGGAMRIGQVVAGGTAALGSASSIIDDRGTLAQAVQARNIEFMAGGDVGQAALPVTVKTASDGAVRVANAGGSVYLRSSSGVLAVNDAQAATGQIALNGSVGGLQLGGTMSAAKGMALTSGSQDIVLTGNADLRNETGSLVLQGRKITFADGASADSGAGSMVLSATGDITLTGLRSANSSASAIVVSSATGSVLDGGDTDTDIRVSSATGGVVITANGSIGNTALDSTERGRSIETDAAALTVTSKTDSVSLAQAGATRDVLISATRSAELLAQGPVVGTKVSSLRGDVTVSSALGGVKLSSLASAQDVTVSAAGRLDLVSVTAPRDVSLNSSGQAAAPADRGASVVSLVAGRHASVIAQGAEADSVLRSLSAGAGTLTVQSGRDLALTTATSAGNASVSSAGDLALGTLTSRTGAIGIDAGGSATFSSASAQTGLTVQAGGAITGTSATTRLGLADLRSDADAVQLGSVSGGGVWLQAGTALTARTLSAGSAGATVLAGGNLTLSGGTATGSLLLDAGGTASLGSLSASAGNLTAIAGQGLRYTSLSARQVSISAHGAAGIQGGTITSTAADGPGTALRVLASSGDVSLGALSATLGGVDIKASGGALSTGSVSAASGVTLRASGALQAAALTSRSGLVQADSLTGAVALTSVSARTGFSASAKTSMALTSFSVSGGGATLSAGGGLSLKTGTATGAIALTMGANGALGTITSSGGSLSATSSGGGLSFTALKAASGLTLSAAKAWGSGSYANYAIYGGSLDAGSSAIAEAGTGAILLTRLSAKAPSRVTTGSGDLRISAVSLLKPSQLLATTGRGLRSLPTGF